MAKTANIEKSPKPARKVASRPKSTMQALPSEAAATAPTKRDQILDAATRVFLQHGYEGTSMDRVAAESNAARRTLYNQFDGKEALFEAMTARIWASFPVFDITRDEESLRDPKVGLTRLGHAVSNFWIPPEAVAFLRMVISEGPRFPALTKTFFEKGKAPAMDAVATYLEALSKRKLVKIKNSKLAARQFLGLIDEPLLWVRVVGIDETYSQQERDVIVENAVDMFLGFYLTRQ
ncbi:TetR/AcrR family transcriptional regulator [Burkholderia gladioli]|uniref:Bacterial regulatory s, tetR family protein n=2 Tax=Burkholderiales TaxID=80840 RepID=A0AAW3FA93_BURGA|nr:TetR/AcrR family transcriptional regulator [Burkholderia gladioli]KGC20238.1 bacterial regulatory s, tetR family protein [Burkholderia gladioli]MBU9170341.1 TetR/AcrR family transcriptional regulator [Burkholderia gladioli]MBU9177339.1 TetR/AcrR family transcriptional regulator [Burkholderia gladioli]MBU9218501.1 TetR/AcrR family transcriptional regulator [Burkholderia gladioli]MBU9384515.1 TetR/AcrR family transcriptional regulator [Burkholderia gladioli]